MAHKRCMCAVRHSVELLDSDRFQMAPSLSKGTKEVRCGVRHFVELLSMYEFYLDSPVRKGTQEVQLRCLALGESIGSDGFQMACSLSNGPRSALRSLALR